MSDLSRILHLSDTPTISDGNSVVSVIGDDNKYLPISNIVSYSLIEQLLFLIPYTGLWAGITYATYQPNLKWSYVIGFVSGLIAIISEIIYKNAQTRVYVNRDDLKSYAFNVVNKNKSKSQVYSPPTDEIVSSNSDLISDDSHGYLVKFDDFHRNIKSSQSLNDYLDTSFREDIGFGRQDDPIFHSDLTLQSSNTGFYLAILCITLAIYVNRSSWANKVHLTWIVSAVTISLVSMGISFGKENITSQFNTVYIKNRLIIIAASFSITAILISSGF